MSANKSFQSRELKNTSYELFILLLSLLSIFNLLLFIIPGIDPVLKGVVSIIDGFISVIFLVDFFYRFFTAESKIDYFIRKWGWADLLASLPAQQLKIFRIFRIIRVFRLLRIYGWRSMVAEVWDNRAGSALYLTIFMVLLVLEFGGMAIVFAEVYDPQANIKTASDGVWWAFVTITTVGYGDRFPVTDQGRLIGFFIMVLGVGTFGVLTGFLANAFLSPAGDSGKEADPDEQYAEMSELRRHLLEQEAVNASILRKLELIEASITAQNSDSSAT